MLFTLLNWLIPKPKHSWQQFEQLAQRFLQQQNIKILRTNYRSPTKIGEIDIIGLEHTSQSIIFCEVKYRSSSIYGGAINSINLTKQRKIIATAQQFMQQYPTYNRYNLRFDCILIEQSSSKKHTIQWLKGAFTIN